MLPDRVSNPGPLTYESGALPIALRGPTLLRMKYFVQKFAFSGKGGVISCPKLLVLFKEVHVFSSQKNLWREDELCESKI